MARFLAKHLLFLLVTLLVVSFLVFTLNEFSPGAVARKILGAYATQEQVEILTKQIPVVFGLVTELMTCEIGINRRRTLQHIAHITGIGLTAIDASPQLGCSRFKLA